MNRRALAISQVFTFIIMILTFAIIMLFGYKAIAGFLESGENVQFVQFKNEIESAFQRISRDYGSVRIEQFHLPPGYGQICFVDLDLESGKKTSEFDLLCQKDPIACTIWKNTLNYNFGEENVFLTPSAPVKIKVARFTISPSATSGSSPEGFLCFPIQQGTFSLKLKGAGDHVVVAEELP